ncbi:uncharacterized protein [Euwallacea similis]|uniref:uncharacterized protein n=1 Tax=Euwallacea similis TaxID=1736056 RepID=UPI00344CE662
MAENLEESHAVNISSNELDEETKEKLKGDCIGDTLYSKSFVIRTLMGLSALNYNEEEEHDLCFLWDMTLEKDVCQLLLDLQYPCIAIEALANCRQERFTEILLGIFGNILIPNCNITIADYILKSAFNEFNTDSPFVCIQLMRLLEIIAYKFPNQIPILGQEVLEVRMQFILNYSFSSELINQTMQTLVHLTEDFKINQCYVSSALFKSVIEGINTVLSLESSNSEVDMDSSETCKIVNRAFNLISNICAYVGQYHHDLEIAEAISCSEKLHLIISKVIIHYSVEENLLPLPVNFNEYILAFQVIFTTRDVRIVSKDDCKLFSEIFKPLCLIVYILHGCKSEVLDSFNKILELVAILIHLVSAESVLNQLRHLDYKKGIVVLNSLKELSRSLKFDIGEKIRFLFEEYK